MSDAFEAKPYIFLHRCVYCKHAKKHANGCVARGFLYDCMVDTSKVNLDGTHYCDVEKDNGDQLTWFEAMRMD